MHLKQGLDEFDQLLTQAHLLLTMFFSEEYTLVGTCHYSTSLTVSCA